MKIVPDALTDDDVLKERLSERLAKFNGQENTPDVHEEIKEICAKELRRRITELYGDRLPRVQAKPGKEPGSIDLEIRVPMSKEEIEEAQRQGLEVKTDDG